MNTARYNNMSSDSPTLHDLIRNVASVEAIIDSIEEGGRTAVMATRGSNRISTLMFAFVKYAPMEFYINVSHK